MIFNHWYVLVILLIIVLIVYGPGKLPEVGGAIGKAMREFRKASSELTDEIKRGTSKDNDTRSSQPMNSTGDTEVKSPTDKTA
jgi:sec-independent protein translocase protein TatA